MGTRSLTLQLFQKRGSNGAAFQNEKKVSNGPTLMSIPVALIGFILPFKMAEELAVAVVDWEEIYVG